jgi:PHD/YefM family antitoxin component YafN of YafNO toxin-antitoxin module
VVLLCDYLTTIGETMTKIIPIKELKDTNKISMMVHEVSEPVYVTKNGYGDMVIMSIETFERTSHINALLSQLRVAELDVTEGELTDAFQTLDDVEQRYGI